MIAVALFLLFMVIMMQECKDDSQETETKDKG